MRRLLILVMASLLVGCISQNDVQIKDIKLTGATMEGLVPKIEAKLSIENKSRTTINIGDIALEVISNDGSKIADIAVADKFKIEGRTTTDVTLQGVVKLADPSILATLFSSGDDMQEILSGLYITGSARVKAGLFSKKMKMGQIKVVDLLEQMEQ